VEDEGARRYGANKQLEAVPMGAYDLAPELHETIAAWVFCACEYPARIFLPDLPQKSRDHELALV